MRDRLIVTGAMFLLILIGGVAEGAALECHATPYYATQYEVNKPLFRVYVFAFEGPGNFGVNIAKLFNIQLWSTLRAADPTLPDSNFGIGLSDMCDQNLPDLSFTTADRASKELGQPVQVVLWGKVSHYADGDIAEAFLSLPEQASTVPDPSKNVWSLVFPLKQKTLHIGLDIPTRHYVFEPIVLKRGVVERFGSNQAWTIYSDRTLQTTVPPPRDGWLRARSYESDGIWLQRPKGWLPVPALSDQRSEIVNFTGGIMRVLRGDWNGAQHLFREVLENEELPIENRVNALIYVGLAKERRGASGRTEFDAAAQLNPLSRKVASFQIMSALAELSSSVPSLATPTMSDSLSRLRTLIRDNQALFEEADPWFATVRRIESEFSEGASAEQRQLRD